MNTLTFNVNTLSTFKEILKLMRAHQPRGTLLLLFPTLIALTLSTHGNTQGWEVIFILGSFITRSLGCIINDIKDKDIDALVWRTQSRPLASKSLTVSQALIVFMTLALMALGLMLLLPTRSWGWCIASFIGLIMYPSMKRFFALPQLFLALVFSMGIPVAFSLNSQDFSLTCWLLFTSNFFWIFAFDSAYALADLIDDQKLPIHTSAKTLKNKTPYAVALSMLLCLCFLTLVGRIEHLSHYFYLSLGISLCLFILQLWLIAKKTPGHALEAFLINPWIGFIWYLGVFFSYC